MRRSISTNRPEIARLDHSVLAVVWIRISRPRPFLTAVTRGVPSASRAQVRLGRSRAGCASTWRETTTSPGTVRPANGDSGENGASLAGEVHDMAPPSARSPARSATGVRLSGFWPRRGPAKRSTVPPRAIQASMASRSLGVRIEPSATISTASRRDSSTWAGPLRSSA